jgi:hypothetical protein
MNKEKPKKKSGTIVIIIFLLCIVAGGGYIGYKHFIADAKYDIEDTAVETKALDTYKWESDDREKEYKEMMDVMEDTDSSFFYIEEKESGYDTYMTLYQTDKNTFDSIASECRTADYVSRFMSKGCKVFFNWNYDTITDNQNTWFGGNSVSTYDGVALLYNGESPYNYFNDNGIKLSCDTFEITKLAVMKKHNDGIQSYQYLMIGNGDVTSVEKKSDPLNIYPDEGQTENLTIKISFMSDVNSKWMGADRVYVEK